jgi:hypothetical protein
MTSTPTSLPVNTPTATPLPTDPPTPVPVPAYFTDEGDAVIDLDLSAFGGVGILNIIGGAEESPITVTSYHAEFSEPVEEGAAITETATVEPAQDGGEDGSDQPQGDLVEVLVEAPGPYNGFRPLNLMREQVANRLEIKTSAPWEITLYPLVAENLRLFQMPGTFVGSGDNLVLMNQDVLMDPDALVNQDLQVSQDAEPIQAHINGNAGGDHFVVLAYTSEGILPVVDTSEPFDGDVVLPAGTFLLEIRALGSWTISIAGS